MSSKSTLTYNFLKKLNFVVLCPEINPASLKATVGSIKSHFKDAYYNIIVPGSVTKNDFSEVSRYGSVFCGRNSITSLINVGMHETNREWNMIVMSGSLPYYGITKKYSQFLKSNKDIIYSVVNKTNWRFEESTINGLLLNKKTMKEVGDFLEEEPNLELCRLAWADIAIKKGFSIKGLVGVRIF